MHGLLQVISLMLAMSGAGIDKDSKAPSADTVLQYEVDDAQAVVYLDVAAVLPRNYKLVTGLADDATVKANPDLLEVAKKIKANVEGVVGMAKSVAGLDPVNDITSMTMFVEMGSSGAPAKLAVVRGKIPSDLITKLASMAGGTAGKVDGRATLSIDADTFLGTSKDGALIVGPEALVKPRIADDWKAPARKKGSAWASIAKQLDDKPFALIAGQLSDTQSGALVKQLGDKNFLTDLVGNGALAVLSLYHDGVGFLWQDRSKEHLARMAMAVDGLVDLDRAAMIAPRGAAKLIVAALDSYAGDKEIDQLIAHKDDLLKLVDEYTSDGKFKVDTKKDDKALTLSVRAKGKSLSDVVPVALVIPGVMAALFLRGHDDEARPVESTHVRAVDAPKPSTTLKPLPAPQQPAAKPPAKPSGGKHK